MIDVHIYAEEWVLLTQDPVVKMLSADLEGIPVNIRVTRREIPCTIAVISEGAVRVEAGEGGLEGVHEGDDPSPLQDPPVS